LTESESVKRKVDFEVAENKENAPRTYVRMVPGNGIGPNVTSEV
jgi:hypothetical protein